MPRVTHLSPAGRQRLMFLFLCFVWGTTWLAMKVGIASIPPGLFAGSRWTVAGLALLGFSVALGQERFSPRQLAAIGLGVVGVLVLFGPSAVAGTLDVAQVAGA